MACTNPVVVVVDDLNATPGSEPTVLALTLVGHAPEAEAVIDGLVWGIRRGTGDRYACGRLGGRYRWFVAREYWRQVCRALRERAYKLVRPDRRPYQ
jgi:hypothetical protein